MSDEAPLTAREAMEREKARLLKEAAAKQAEAAAVDRDMAEIDRLTVLAAKYNLVLEPASEARAARNERQSFDGSVASLADHYRTNPLSPYRKLKHNSRLHYDALIKNIVDGHGHKKLADLKTPEIQGIYEDWKQRGEQMAHALATMLRGLINFGAVLAYNECERLSIVLHNQRFKVQKQRSERLTREQANAIRTEAHRMEDRRSIALAQAFQFECGLWQSDVIGEWVPVEESGTSEIIGSDNDKWLRGLRWNEIDENLKLRRESRGELDLKRAAMVIEELRSLFCDRGEPLTRAKLPVKGPIIVYERTGLPYQAHTFRRLWREVADAAGIPKNVKNMDSRRRGRAREKSMDDQEREPARDAPTELPRGRMLPE